MSSNYKRLSPLPFYELTVRGRWSVFSGSSSSSLVVFYDHHLQFLKRFQILCTSSLIPFSRFVIYITVQEY